MNNRNFKKTLVAIAAGATLSALGMAAANAESLLFPYWSTENGTTSVLSLAAGPVIGTGNGAGNIHYVWNYGSACTHFDNYGKLTANDLIQQFVSQPQGTPALFGDKSTPAYFPQINGGTSGFLIVSDLSSGQTAGGSVGPLGSLRGQMVIASASAGIVTAYSGIPQTSAGLKEGDFSALNANQYRLSWYPQSVVNPTSWFAVVTGDMSGVIGTGSNWTGSSTYSNGGNVYGRDETHYSGTMGATFTCSVSLTPTSFMNSAQIASATNGGLVNVTFAPSATTTSGAAADPSTGVILTKLETTTALGATNTFITPEKATSGQGW